METHGEDVGGGGRAGEDPGCRGSAGPTPQLDTSRSLTKSQCRHPQNGVAKSIPLTGLVGSPCEVRHAKFVVRGHRW